MSRHADRTSYAPRGLRSPAAAAYVGVSEAKFAQWVKDGRMPKAVKIDGCVVWDRYKLDAAFDALSDSDVDDAKANPWAGVAASGGSVGNQA
jgi:predicted DNA-binding transcriptional regulator AlpA